MKKILWLAATFVTCLGIASTVHAATTFPVNGGTGSTTLSGIILGNGTSPVNTLTIGTGLNLTGTTLTATGGSGTISTSSPLTAGLLVQSTGANTIANIATSTLGISTSDIVEGTKLFFTNARAIAATLTGYVSGAGTISSSDSILIAIEKLNGNISALVTGVSSVSNSDGTVTVTPTTGNPVVSLALSHSNTWTGLQQFNNSTSTLASLGTTWLTGITGSTQCLHVDSNGKVTGTGSDCGTGSGGVTNLSATYPIKVSGSTGSITISTDLSSSTLTATAPLTGSFAQVGTGGTLGCQVASGSQAGCLASADFTTFNGKQAAGNYLTALTGDGTASGPGSSALTLATVNSDVGTFIYPSVTVNGKGLVTAISNGTAPTTYTGFNPISISASNVIAIATSSASQSGFLSAADFALLHTATTTFSSPLVYTQTTNAVTCPTCTIGGITALGNYATTTGTAISFSTSTVTVNGLTYGLAIAPSANAILFTPTITGTYNGQAGSVANSLSPNSTLNGSSFNGSSAVSNWGLNLANSNWWTARQNFTNASSSLLEATSSLRLAYLSGAGAGNFLAVDNLGYVIATSSPSGSNSAFSPSANYATVTGLPAYTYLSGVITEVSNGALSVDGANPAIGQRVLVKNESGSCTSSAGACNNGLYDVTAAGSGIAAFVLTRDAQYNSSSNVIPGIITYVISGTVNNDDFWAMTSAAPITVGTTALNYIEVSGGGASVTTVSNSDGTLTISPTAGNVVASLALTHANTWTGQQTFNSSAPIFGTLSGVLIGNSSSAITAGSTQTCTNQFIRVLSNAFVATCATVNLASDVTGTLPIANGGTATTTGGNTNGIEYFDGSKITNSSNGLFNGTNLSLGTTTFGSLLSLGGIANFTTATSTFYSSGGLNITHGCFAVNSTCLTSGASFSGTTGQVDYFNATNNAVGTSSIFIATNGAVGIGTTSPSAFQSVQYSDMYVTSSTSVWTVTGSTFSPTVPANSLLASIQAWGGGGGGAGGGNGEGAGSGAFIATTTISNPTGTMTIIVAAGGSGGNGTTGGAGGGGFATGGTGANGTTGCSTPGGGGGGGGGSSEIIINSITIIAAGGGGGGCGNLGGGAANTTSGGLGGGGGGSSGGGGGGAASTNGSNGSGATGGAGGTGATLASGTGGGGHFGSGNNVGAGGSAAGVSGNGNGGGAGSTGGAGSGGATGGVPGAGSGSPAGPGANGTGADSGGAGGGGSQLGTASNGGAGAVPAAGGGGSGGTGSPVGGAGGAGKIILTFYSLATPIPATINAIFNITSPATLASFDDIQFIQFLPYHVMTIDQVGHVITGGPSPSCGTGCASVTGDDRTMFVTVGTTVTSATINFANTYTKTPACFAEETGSGLDSAIGASTTPSTITLAFPVASAKVYQIVCQISNNFTF